MIRELNMLNDFRGEIQNFAESVICEQSMFLNDDLYRESVLTESFALLVMAGKFYKKGFDLYNQAKEKRCYQESSYTSKLDIAYTAQSFVGLAEQILRVYYQENRPMYFYTKDGGDRLAVRGLLKLMHQGKFDSIDSLINKYVANMFIDMEYINKLCKFISGIDKFTASIFVDGILEEGLYSICPISNKEEIAFNSSRIIGGLFEEVVISKDLTKEEVVISGGLFEKEDAVSGGLSEKEVFEYTMIPCEEVTFSIEDINIPEKIDDDSFKKISVKLDENNKILVKKGNVTVLGDYFLKESVATSDIDEWDDSIWDIEYCELL